MFYCDFNSEKKKGKTYDKCMVNLKNCLMPLQLTQTKHTEPLQAKSFNDFILFKTTKSILQKRLTTKNQ